MKKKVISTLFSVVAVSAMLITGCGSSNSAQTQSSSAPASSAAASTEAVAATATSDAGAAAPGDAAGFTENPIFEDAKVDFMNVSAVYFQPVPMAPGQEDISKFNMHLECDVHALKNDLGYGVGDWIPYLTIDYDIKGSDGKTAASGTFMEMSASDGPHYGANINLPKADTYSVTFTFHSPAENGYLIHSDKETGPGGVLEDHFKNGNLTYTYKGWDYTPQEW